MKILDFQRHLEYQEQPNLLEKTIIVFLDPHQKMHAKFVGYSWNIQEIPIPIFIIPGALFGNIPRNFIGSIYQIFRKYTMGILHEYFTSIYLPSGKATILQIILDIY